MPDPGSRYEGWVNPPLRNVARSFSTGREGFSIRQKSLSSGPINAKKDCRKTPRETRPAPMKYDKRILCIGAGYVGCHPVSLRIFSLLPSSRSTSLFSGRMRISSETIMAAGLIWSIISRASCPTEISYWEAMFMNIPQNTPSSGRG